MATLPNSGQLKFSDIRSQFRPSDEQSGTISMGDYYRNKNVDGNGSIVGNGGIVSNIPTSGEIDMSNFRGTGHNITNNTTLQTLTNQALGFTYSQGTRSPADMIRNYLIVYAGAQNKPSNSTASNGIYNLTAGDKYVYLSQTSGSRNAARRLGNSNSTVGSRGYNSAESYNVMDNMTLNATYNGNVSGSTGYGRQGTFTHTNAVVNSGSGSSAGTLIFKNTQSVSDPGKGTAVAYVFDYRFMKKVFEDLGYTFRNTL
jgi:hypothetical protein